MRRPILTGMVVFLLAGIAVVFLYGDRLASRYTESRSERMIRQLNGSEVLVRRSCGLGAAYVDAARWRKLGATEQQRAADAIATWCASQGGEKTLTIFDAETRATLGRWNGTALESGQ